MVMMKHNAFTLSAEILSIGKNANWKCVLPKLICEGMAAMKLKGRKGFNQKHTKIQ